MDRFEPNLRIPGPTALPPSVREAGARQMINHRGPEFAAMLARILDGMKPYFGTTSDVAMITTAGTGGLEAAVVIRETQPGAKRVEQADRLLDRSLEDRRWLLEARQARGDLGHGGARARRLRERGAGRCQLAGGPLGDRGHGPRSIAGAIQPVGFRAPNTDLTRRPWRSP